jgi:hypothetical protein
MQEHSLLHLPPINEQSKAAPISPKAQETGKKKAAKQAEPALPTIK